MLDQPYSTRNDSLTSQTTFLQHLIDQTHDRKSLNRIDETDNLYEQTMFYQNFSPEFNIETCEVIPTNHTSEGLRVPKSSMILCKEQLEEPTDDSELKEYEMNAK